MSECRNCETLVSEWIDDQLGRREQVQCLDHLARCVSCRKFYLDARALDGLVAALRTPAGAERPSSEVWRRIERVVDKDHKRRRFVPAWALQAAAVVVVAIGLSIVVWNGSAVAPSSAPERAEIELGSDPMTETRFVELTREILQADRRYHSAMYRVMERVVRDTAATDEASREDAVRPDEEGRIDEDGETAAGAPA